MPRKQRIRRVGPGYGPDHKDHLRTGSDFFGGGFGSGAYFREEDAADAWDALRGEILLEHIREYPCTRPWAWWMFEPHEGRLCVSPPPRGTENGDGGDEPDDEGDENGRRRYGIRSPYWGRDRAQLLFESQAHFLRRYGLLTKAEKAYLERHPDLLEPVTGWQAENR